MVNSFFKLYLLLFTANILKSIYPPKSNKGTFCLYVSMGTTSITLYMFGVSWNVMLFYLLHNLFVNN